MKAVRQARLELSGGSTPDQLKPPPTATNPPIHEWRIPYSKTNAHTYTQKYQLAYSFS